MRLSALLFIFRTNAVMRYALCPAMTPYFSAAVHTRDSIPINTLSLCRFRYYEFSTRTHVSILGVGKLLLYRKPNTIHRLDVFCGSDIQFLCF